MYTKHAAKQTAHIQSCLSNPYTPQSLNRQLNNSNQGAKHKAETKKHDISCVCKGLGCIQ